ncbi:Thioredoxin [Macleaya cordata]|uniref:Thioredoxin n=1 Tax=Macleaya cordata TaxID=56857 RepID=A0A200QF28_MACCD|nr:Thioredoxin [Macleaya cordata]
MGSSLSSSSTGDSSESSRVQAIHSSGEWRNHFNSLKNSSQLIVIDFTATWCGPCKMMAPIFADLAEKFTDVVFVKIDVDELMDVSREFGVQAMPTFVLLKQGKEVDKVVGAKKDELEKKIEMHRTPGC